MKVNEKGTWKLRAIAKLLNGPLERAPGNFAVRASFKGPRGECTWKLCALLSGQGGVGGVLGKGPAEQRAGGP